MLLSQMLGIRVPIIQAPMAGVQDATLAATVSNAGGLGSLPCAMLPPGELEAEIDRLNGLTNQPYNLNFFCHASVNATAQEQAEWEATLSRYFKELGLDAAESLAGPLREPFNEDALSIVETYAPAVVSFHFGLPRRDWVERIKLRGSIVLSTATTVEEAVWLVDNGVDAIIAQGLEAGGHRGSFLSEDMTTQSGTLSLVPQVCDKVPVPVIAAGGIAGRQGVSAAMALGAAGVQVGTAFLLCPETNTSSLHRTALMGNASVHTALTNVFTGRPARSIVNRLVREIGPMATAIPPFPAAAALVSALRRSAEPAGNSDFTPLWCGQNASGCREASAADILRELAKGYRPETPRSSTAGG